MATRCCADSLEESSSYSAKYFTSKCCKYDGFYHRKGCWKPNIIHVTATMMATFMPLVLYCIAQCRFESQCYNNLSYISIYPYIIPQLSIPVKTLLQDLTRKGSFSCIPARSCKILWFCSNLAGILHKIHARFLQYS